LPESLSDLSLLNWILFAIAGIAAGIINTLAGSGSLITLPIFMFVCGLPANIANGTNRVGVIFQSAIGLRGFQKSEQVDFRNWTWIVIPAVIGALIGARLASEMTAKQMRFVIGGLMVVMLIVLLVNPKRWIRESDSKARNNRSPVSVIIYFCIGIYGGFLKEGNGIKLLVVLAFAIPTLFVFWWADTVHFGFGLLMAVFQSIGAVLGVQFATKVPNANIWIHRLLILILIAAATKIFLFDTPKW